MKTLKIKGVKKAVGDYNRANAGGYYSPRYGKLMLDRSTGEVWTDEFYSLGHNSWTEYHDPAIVNLGYFMAEEADGEAIITMATVRAAAEKYCAEYTALAAKNKTDI